MDCETATVKVFPYIEPEIDPPHVVDAEAETLSGVRNFWGGMEIRNGGSVTVEESADVTIYEELTLSDGAALFNHGSVTAESITVKGTGNVISGIPVAVHSIPVYHILGNSGKSGSMLFVRSRIYVEENADLTISKNQYDFFGGMQVDGQVYVEKSNGNALRQKDIDLLVSAGRIRHITFRQDLNNVNNLVFTEGLALTVGFEDAYGTEKNDIVRFCRNSKITLGETGFVMDLFEGKNQIRTDADAQVAVLSDLRNISTLQVSSGTKTKAGKVSYQNFTEFSCKDAAFFENIAGSIFIGNYSIVSTGTLTGGNRTDKITVGHNSSLQTGKIKDFEQISIGSGEKWKEASFDPQKIQGFTHWTAGDIENQVSLKIVMGNYTEGTVGRIQVGIFTIPISGEEPWTFDIDKSNDSIRIGKHAVLNAESVHLGNGKNSILVGTDSQFKISGEAEGVWKLQLADGKKDQGACFSAETVVGTEFSDTLSFGNYSVVRAGNISLSKERRSNTGNDCILVGKYARFQAGTLTFGEGNDRLEIRDHADVNIGGLMNFGAGKDRLIIGKNALVVLKAADTDSLVRFSIGRGTEAYLSTELLNCRILRKYDTYLYDIGSAQEGVAQNFTSLSREQEDNTSDHAQTLTGTQYDGWLCGESSLDIIDFFQKGTAAELVCGETSAALMVSQWDSAGEFLRSDRFSGTVGLCQDAVSFSIGLSEEPHYGMKALAYHFTLA